MKSLIGDPKVFTPGSRLFWAKTFSDQDSHSRTFGLSVVQHSIDVSNVIYPVAQNLVSAGVLQGIQDSIPLDLELFLKFLACTHDCGKISKPFQSKAIEACSGIISTGYSLSNVSPKNQYEFPHNAVSAIAVHQWLADKINALTGKQQIPIDINTTVGLRQLLAGHHGFFSKPEKIELGIFAEHLADVENPEYNDVNPWIEARNTFLNEVARYLGMTDEDLQGLVRIDWKEVPVPVIEGILICADWVGSSHHFPLLPHSEPLNRQQSEARAQRALSELELGGSWSPTPVTAETFPQRSGLPAHSTLSPLQETALQIAQQADSPAFYLIEAETGSGKTEAALAMAEVLSAKFNCNGLFFAQPTRVTSDAMFDRVVRWVEHSDCQNASPVSAILAHGKANLHSTFTSLVPQKGSIFADESAGKTSIPGHLAAYEWFRGRHTSLLAHIVVGTIDQLLMSALKMRFVSLRHLGLASKVVIIDELHASDTWMQTYLTRALTWLGKYGVPVIGLSATLPPELRNKLLEAYTAEISTEVPSSIDISVPYPAITSISANGVDTTPIPSASAVKPRNVEVEFLDGDLEELATHIYQSATTGGKIAAICTTVHRAQKLYELIKDQLVSVVNPPELVLLHSRFTADQRRDRETKLVEALGRPAGDSAPDRNVKFPNGCIVVSTQVIEQGLDLDFDLMYSDIAPIDLIIQRMGRIHRHRQNDAFRPVDLQNPALVIAGVRMEDGIPAINSRICKVYQEAILLRTLATLNSALAEKNYISIPDEVQPLIDTAHDSGLQAPEGWEDLWKCTRDKEIDAIEEQKKLSKKFLLPPPSQDLEAWAIDPHRGGEHQAMAHVRDSDSFLEVIVCQAREDGHIYPLKPIEGYEDYMLDVLQELEDDVARRVAECSLRLPSWLATDEIIDVLEKDGIDSWQNSPWLRGELPLILDHLGNKLLPNGVTLRYSDEYGLEEIWE